MLFCSKQTTLDIHIQVSVPVKGDTLVSQAHGDSSLTKF